MFNPKMILAFTIALTTAAGCARAAEPSRTAESEKALAKERALPAKQLPYLNKVKVPGGLPTSNTNSVVRLFQDRINNPVCSPAEQRAAKQHRDWSVAKSCFSPRSYVY